jgi:hypothetical protein
MFLLCAILIRFVIARSSFDSAGMFASAPQFNLAEAVQRMTSEMQPACRRKSYFRMQRPGDGAKVEGRQRDEGRPGRSG